MAAGACIGGRPYRDGPFGKTEALRTIVKYGSRPGLLAFNDIVSGNHHTPRDALPGLITVMVSNV